MDSENKFGESQLNTQEIDSANGVPFTPTSQNPLTQQTRKDASKLISTNLILIISVLVAVVMVLMWSFSDVRNTEDYLAPVVMVILLVLATALYSGKRWGLIGFTIFMLTLFVVVFFYYIDYPIRMRNTMIALSPVLLLIGNLWFRKRAYFS